ncbi:MAG: hypothetical protein RLZ37_1875, partial [Actinomycetota bacterium]
MMNVLSVFEGHMCRDLSRRDERCDCMFCELGVERRIAEWQTLRQRDVP